LLRRKCLKTFPINRMTEPNPNPDPDPTLIAFPRGQVSAPVDSPPHSLGRERSWSDAVRCGAVRCAYRESAVQ
jgi:hypothetical protein